MIRSLLGSITVNKVKYSFYELPTQSNTSIWVEAGSTRMLCVVTRRESEGPDDRLAVNYRERYFAASKIPGGGAKRESLSNREILVSRFVDKSIRPLLASQHGINISCTLYSHDRRVNVKDLAVWASGIAVARADISIQGPVASITSKTSDHKLSLACTPTSIVACELGSVPLSTEAFRKLVIDTIVNSEIVKVWEFTKTITNFYTSPTLSQDYVSQLTIHSKEMAWEQFSRDVGYDHALFNTLFHTAASRQPRQDHRDFNEVRHINLEVGLLPSSAGSAHFARGETEVIASVTITTNERDAYIEDSATRRSKRQFYVQYNFAIRNYPTRREIGHSELIYNALKYTMQVPSPTRLVADVLSANGSSSMASVCAGSLALHDAGLTDTLVAGVSIGLFGDSFVVDLTADEDTTSAMDYKVAGTQNSITAIQLDTKSPISIAQFFDAIPVATRSIESILAKMRANLPAKSIDIKNTSANQVAS